MGVREEAGKIIHSSMVTSAVASGALSQAVGSDMNVVLPVAANMVRALGSLFEREIDHNTAAAVASQLLAKTGSAALVLGFVPGFGNIFRGGMTAAAMRSAGWAVFDALSKGEEISSLSPAQWQDHLARGRQSAESVK